MTDRAQQERDRATPMRVTIAVYDSIVAEAIVHLRDADTLWARWTNLRHSRNLPAGGAIIQRADLPLPASIAGLRRGDVREWQPNEVSDDIVRQQVRGTGRAVVG